MDFTYLLSYEGGTVIFLGVLFTGEHLFMQNYKKKSNFALRATCSALVTVAAGVGLTVPYYIADRMFGGEILASVAAVALYLIMFSLTVAGNKVCYDESFAGILSSCLAGYACQYIYFGLYSAVNVATDFETLIYSSLGLADMTAMLTVGYILTALVQIAFASVVLTACYFAVARKSNKISPNGLVKINVVFITGSTLMTVLIFNVFCDFFTAGSVSAAVFGKCLIVACCVFALVFYYNMLKAAEAQNDFDIVVNLNMAEHRHFEKLKADMELISVKCHDIKHFITDGGRRRDIDTAELNELVDIYDGTVKTGNEIIDTLIAERSLYCTAHNIRLTVIADASPLDFISVTDMCSLFGNMLENAIEAASGVSDENRRIIDVNIRPVAGQVFFCMENGCENAPEIEDGLPVTTKGDSRYHGFGMKSIKLICEKYDGSFSCGAENGIFRVNMLFPIKRTEK